MKDSSRRSTTRTGSRSLPKQRTVNPPIARYNFLYTLKATCGRPPAASVLAPADRTGPAGYRRPSRSITVLAMESPLRRALRWLGLAQPNGSGGAGAPLAGTPFRASYVCPICGALVATSAQERHDAWHQRIGG
jgi:hypothetical protein